MAETAAHIVDSVIPDIPTRQWVLSLPTPLRYLTAYDSEACNFVLAAFIGAVSSFLQLKAKNLFSLSSVSKAHPGTITFVQRFGSAMNLNVHFHTLFTNGVYLEDDSGNVKFQQLPAPTQSEIMQVTEFDTYREERSVDGFNLHAFTAILAGDRDGLERILRYMGRPPISEKRLSLASDGSIIIRLKTRMNSA